MSVDRQPLPDRVSGHVGGNHSTAINRTRDILRYVGKAITCLEGVQDEALGARLRGGYLLQGDEYLDTIIRFAECAKDQLRIEHLSPPETADDSKPVATEAGDG